MNAPLVTLGMPARNEAEFIRESLDCLLAQTYPNVEIIIADNASTDGTAEICQEYARKYPNVRHVRHEKILAQHDNFNSLPPLAKGKYFCWMAGHDLWESTFVAECVKVLEAKPKCVLAFPRTTELTRDKRPIREAIRHFDIEKMSPGRRFREVMWRVDCHYVYGMWRLEAMLQSKIFQPIPAPDRVFLSEMAMKGTFAPAEAYKYCRLNRPEKQDEAGKRRRLMDYIAPGKVVSDSELMRNEFYRPTLLGFYAVVREANLPAVERIICNLSVWLSGVMKMHLFPGADALSAIVKRILPRPVLNALIRRMQ